MEESLKNKMKKVLNDLEEIIADIQNNQLENEQDTLNFMDCLNKLSVMF